MEMAPTRLSGQFAALLRRKLYAEEFTSGQLLPGERTLARQFNLSGKTVRRALKILEAEALIAPESRRGYRVLGRANDPNHGHPLALVISKPATEGAGWFYRRLLGTLQDAASRRGWSLLGIQRDGRTTGEIAAHLKAARASGAIVDSADGEVGAAIARLGLPVVLADAWCESLALDTVAQDGFLGGMLAAAYLAAQGCTRLAFVGPELQGAAPQKIERFGGAAAGAARAGLALEPGLCIGVPQGDEAAIRVRVRKLLTRAHRPDGILALWQGMSVAVDEVAAELGLLPGRDFHLVGWSTAEDYTQEFASKFKPGRVPPALVWSMAGMAEQCILRLMQRRADPHLPVSFTRLPIKLVLPD